MGNVVSFDGSGPPKSRRELARWLREIAALIEADNAETEPHAALLVLTGINRHEVVSAGYGEDGEGFQGAVSAAYTIGTMPYERIGGNIAQRNHPRYGRPYRSDNIAQFALPAVKPEPE